MHNCLRSPRPKKLGGAGVVRLGGAGVVRLGGAGVVCLGGAGVVCINLIARCHYLSLRGAGVVCINFDRTLSLPRVLDARLIINSVTTSYQTWCCHFMGIKNG